MGHLSRRAAQDPFTPYNVHGPGSQSWAPTRLAPWACEPGAPMHMDILRWSSRVTGRAAFPPTTGTGTLIIIPIPSEETEARGGK